LPYLAKLTHNVAQIRQNSVFQSTKQIVSPALWVIGAGHFRCEWHGFSTALGYLNEQRNGAKKSRWDF